MHNITIASDNLKHHDVDWVFGFNQYEYKSILRLTPECFEIFVMGVPGVNVNLNSILFPNFMRRIASLYVPKRQGQTGSSLLHGRQSLKQMKPMCEIKFKMATIYPACIYIYIYMYIFTNPSARAGYDTRSIFKRAFNRFEFRVFFLDRLIYPYLPTPPLGQDMTQGQFLSALFNRFEFRVFFLDRLIYPYLPIPPLGQDMQLA